MRERDNATKESNQVVHTAIPNVEPYTLKINNTPLQCYKSGFLQALPISPFTNGRCFIDGMIPSVYHCDHPRMIASFGFLQDLRSCG